MTADAVARPRWCLGKRLSGVLNLVDDSLESCGIVESEIGEHLAVELKTALVDKTHELAVGEVLEACGGVDTLDPEGAEVGLLVAAVTEGVGKTLFPGVLCYGPDVAAATEVTAGELEDFLSTSA